MSEEEHELWDKNIKSENKWLWLTTIKWRLYLFGMRIREKKRKTYTINDVDVSWEKALKYLLILMGISIIVSMGLSVLEYFWPKEPEKIPFYMIPVIASIFTHEKRSIDNGEQRK